MKHARPDYDRIQDPSGKIPDTEPVVLFRAQDQFAAGILDHAAAVYLQAGLSDMASAMQRQARLFRGWPIKKIPDL